MPTYGYECQLCSEQFEVFQKITEDSLKVHEGCGGTLKKLVYPVGIAFKGSGFYVNDYAAKKAPVEKAADSGATKSETTSATETKTESKSETKSETKTESTASTPAAPVAASTAKPSA